MREQKWERNFPVSDLWESTILMIGFGDIGKNLAPRAKAMGMQVLAVKRTLTDKNSSVDELYTVDALDSLLPRADYVVVCEASKTQTEGIMDKTRIGLMKKGSYLIMSHGAPITRTHDQCVGKRPTCGGRPRCDRA